MQIEIWSDIVCPFCYVGKAAMAQALQGFEHADEVTVVGRSFELDPTADGSSQGPIDEMLARKYGMSRQDAAAQNDRIASLAAQYGLEFNWRIMQTSGTRDAHRLLALADTLGKRQDAEDRFMRAYFVEGRCVGDHETLRELSAEVGLPSDRVDAVLASDEFGDVVTAQERAAQGMGVNGVPFFLMDEQYAFSGAQPVSVMSQVLDQVWQETHATPTPDAEPASDRA